MICPPLITCRVRLIVPPLQAAEHSVQGVNLDSEILLASQSLGQGMLLMQFRVSSRIGQAVPPLAAATTVDRVRNWTPWPHEPLVMQEPHEDHSLTRQSVGQSNVLQDFFSSSAGHPKPPLELPCIMYLRRVENPSPHSCEHMVHSS